MVLLTFDFVFLHSEVGFLIKHKWLFQDLMGLKQLTVNWMIYDYGKLTHKILVKIVPVTIKCAVLKTYTNPNNPTNKKIYNTTN